MSPETEVLPNPESDQLRLKLLGGPTQVDLPRHLHYALRESGTTVGQVVKEIAKLAIGPGRLSPHEYMLYKLYDPGMAFARKAEYLGKRVQTAMHLPCNDRPWFAVAHDKLLFYATMAGEGLPVPSLLAVVHPSRRSRQAAALRSPEAVRDFLRTLKGPAFAKPIDGVFSLGCISIERVEQDGRVQLAFGREVTLDALVQRICCSKESGYMIQERLRPHPAVERLFGPTIGTLRLVVLLGADGQPEIVRSLWKIPAGQNIADNFWRGNLLGCVDADTGMLSRVVAGTGIDQRQVEIHPDTGQHLAGAAVPDWIQVRDLCLRAASSLPGIRTQAWDIAVTDGGPVLVEVNFGGDISLPQIACGRGMLDERYREHLRRCGYKGKL